MDTALAAYIKDKNQFLADFASGSYIVNPVILGIILAYSQPDLNSSLVLQESLERCIMTLQDPIHKSYCFAKYYIAAYHYLNTVSEENAKFYRTYFYISNLLSDTKLQPSISKLISEYFQKNFFRLLAICSSSLNFITIFSIGKKNLPMFSRTPMIFMKEIADEIEVMSRVREEVREQTTMLSIFSICRTLKYGSVDEKGVIMKFVLTVIKILLAERIKKQALEEFLIKIKDLIQAFDEEIKVGIEAASKEAAGRLGVAFNGFGGGSEIFRIPERADLRSAGNIPNLRASGLNEAQPFQYLQNSSASAFKAPNAPINSPFAPYSQQPSLPPQAKSPMNPQHLPPQAASPMNPQHLPPQTTNPMNPQQKLIKIPDSPYRNSDNQIPNKPKTGPPQSKQPSKIPPNSHPQPFALKSEAPQELAIENSELKGMLQDIIKAYKEHFNSSGAIDSQSIQAYFSEIFQNHVNAEFELFSSFKELMSASSINDHEIDFWKQMIEACEDNLKETDRESLYKIMDDVYERGERPSRGRADFGRRPQSRGARQSFDRGERWVVQNPSKSWVSEGVKKDIEFIPARAISPPCLRTIVNKDPPQAEELPIVKALGVLSADLAGYLRTYKGNYDDIIALTEPLSIIKEYIKQKSPSAILRLVGSCHIDTYIKNTDIDVLFIDFLNPDPISMLSAACSSVGKLELNRDLLQFTPGNSKYKFRIRVNNEIFNELSNLVRQYCKISTTCQELIIAIKLWARFRQVYESGYLTGFHFSLLAILYLQRLDKNPLPRLQQIPHLQRMISGRDVGFDTNCEYQDNPKPIGEHFYEFLAFLDEYCKKDYIGNVSDGVISEGNSDYLFSMFNPFSDQEVSVVLKNSEAAQRIKKALEDSLALINQGEKLNKIMRS